MNKGLEALYKIANTEMKEQYKASKNAFVYRVISDEYSKELKIIEKELKALEIIKKIIPSFVHTIKSSKDYDDYSNKNIVPFISNEDYDLLKEVL